MKTSHKLGLSALLLSTLASVVACSSDDNASPSDGTGGTIISGSGGKKGSGGNDSGSGGGDNSGGTDQGGAPNTGGTGTGTGGFIEPPNPDCNEDDDFNSTDECWDIHKRPCNGKENIHFFNQCTNGGFCGDEAFDNSQIKGWSGGKLPTPS